MLGEPNTMRTTNVAPNAAPIEVNTTWRTEIRGQPASRRRRVGAPGPVDVARSSDARLRRAPVVHEKHPDPEQHGKDAHRRSFWRSIPDSANRSTRRGTSPGPRQTRSAPFEDQPGRRLDAFVARLADREDLRDRHASRRCAGRRPRGRHRRRRSQRRTRGRRSRRRAAAASSACAAPRGPRWRGPRSCRRHRC